MTCLMKKRKPELIVREVPKAQQQVRPRGGQEPRGATCSTPRRRSDDRNCDAAFSTNIRQLRNEPIRVLLAGQRSNSHNRLFNRTRSHGLHSILKPSSSPCLSQAARAPCRELKEGDVLNAESPSTFSGIFRHSATSDTPKKRRHDSNRSAKATPFGSQPNLTMSEQEARSATARQYSAAPHQGPPKSLRYLDSRFIQNDAEAPRRVDSFCAVSAVIGILPSSSAATCGNVCPIRFANS